MATLFTGEDTWHGGFYELALELGEHSDAGMSAALQWIWSYGSLEGCYLRPDIEPNEQHRVGVPEELAEPMHLYGVALLPNGQRTACGTFVVRETDGPDWIGFYVPMGAIEEFFDAGGYPFNIRHPRKTYWQDFFDTWLLELGKYVFEAVPYRLGLLGHEVSGDYYADDIQRKGVPVARPIGFLWPSASGLDYYPRNCEYGGAPLPDSTNKRH